ncbi:MAG: hypothetical protein AAFR42_00640 [Cyanobacteria bacterium J06628_6]
MVNPQSPDGYDPFVRALMRFSERAKTAERQLVQPSELQWLLHAAQEDASLTDYEVPRVLPTQFYAEPLAPLRDRDEAALDDIFQSEDVEEAVSDVQARLQQIYPEPCWEDEPYDFLHGYI